MDSSPFSHNNNTQSSADLWEERVSFLCSFLTMCKIQGPCGYSYVTKLLSVAYSKTESFQSNQSLPTHTDETLPVDWNKVTIHFLFRTEKIIKTNRHCILVYGKSVDTQFSL